MKLTFEPLSLPLRQPFRLATGTRSKTDIILIRLEDRGAVGLGEASLPPALGENQDSVMKFLERVDPNQLDLTDPIKTKTYIDNLSEGSNAAKAGLEMSFLNLGANKDGKGLVDFYGTPFRPIQTCYTIGISNSQELEAKLNEARQFKFLKLKLGSSDDKDLITQFKKRCDKPFFVDVNQGWSDLGFAMDMVGFLKENGCLFVEQPFDAQDLETHGRLKDESILPVFADESILRFKDLVERGHFFDGVVVKLMKATGLIEAHKMLLKAKEMGLRTVMGCMAESSLAVSHASIIASHADYADLDGAFLLKDDPFRMVHYEDGFVHKAQH